ncbi:MAG: hypothetical protein HZB26_00065 [Candidatus Hydrogenedentes bacterium]|nr:hypothetical protein [Candidatus Hydrogenedentota bacterium]
MKPIDDITDLDSLVRSAIAERAAQPVPFGLRRKIENRIRLAALIQVERGCFVRSLAARSMVLALLVGAFVLTTYLAGAMDGQIMGMIPGGLGYLDYAATMLLNTWIGALDQPILGAILVAAGVVLLAVIPAKSYMRNRFQ